MAAIVGVGPAIFALWMLRNCIAGKINKRRRASPYWDVFGNASYRVLFRDYQNPHGNATTLLAFVGVPSQELHPVEGLSLRTSITYALRFSLCRFHPRKMGEIYEGEEPQYMSQIYISRILDNRVLSHLSPPFVGSTL